MILVSTGCSKGGRSPSLVSWYFHLVSYLVVGLDSLDLKCIPGFLLFALGNAHEKLYLFPTEVPFGSTDENSAYLVQVFSRARFISFWIYFTVLLVHIGRFVFSRN